MHIIPAIDLLSGKVCQLVQGKLGTEKFYGDPVEVAKKFNTEILHIVDLDSTLGTGKNNYGALKKIRDSVDCKINFGGGIRSAEKASEILKILGSEDKIILGTFALEGVDMLREHKDRIIVAVDSLKGKVVVKGWKEKTSFDTIDFMRNFYGKAFGFLFTDVDVEGKMQGINFTGVKKVVEESKLPIIVSGGISSIDDIESLRKINPYGIVIGKAIYEGKINLFNL